MRRVHVWAAGLMLSLLLPAAAQAAWPGTPGRIAWVSGDQSTLQVVDPVPGGTGSPIAVDEATMPQSSGVSTYTYGSTAPAWSPDGTTLAYVKGVEDPGLSQAGVTVNHTAIFTWNVETGATNQITTPPQGYPDCGGADNCNQDDAYNYADASPTWSPDGKTIAFVRTLAAGKDAGLYSHRGGNVYTVSATGGGATEYYDAGVGNYIMSMAAGGDPSAGKTALVGVRVAEGSDDGALIRLDGGGSSLLGSIKSAGLLDYDVSSDGQHVDYLGGSRGGDTASEIGINGGSDNSLGDLYAFSGLRASPTGNGALYKGYVVQSNGQPKAGLWERQRQESDRDQWSEDPPDRYLYAPPSGFSVPNGSEGARLSWDVQPLHLPIIGIPGFAGSKLYCNENVEWPISANPYTNGGYMHDLALDASGNSPNCPGAGPDQDPLSDDGIVNKVFGVKNVYQPMTDFIHTLGPQGQSFMFNWDWRMSPGDNEQRLHEAVDQILGRDFARAQGAHQVVFYGHSYGGLLARQYVQDYPNDVGRVLTAGTPYWGAPKALFAVAFGIENPLSGILDLDTFVPNAAMKEFMKYNAGVYHLLPSSHFGSWLTIGNDDQDQQGTAAWMSSVGGADSGLISSAYGWHESHDGFYTDNGQIDMRAVIGTGTLTITGARVTAQPDSSGDIRTHIFLGDGDGTVPSNSANQGPVGTHSPLGDPVHVQAVCHVEHVPLPGDSQVTTAYKDYLLHGRTPLKTTGPCTASASAVEIKNLDVHPDSGAGANSASHSRAPADSNQLSLYDAWYDGYIQLVPLPHDPTAITDDSSPVDLSVGNPNGPVEVLIRHFSNGVEGATEDYGPLTGDVVVHSGGSGASVTDNGQPVSPIGSGGGGSGGGGSGGSGSSSGGSTTTAASGGSTSGLTGSASTAVTAGGPATITLRLAGAARSRRLRSALKGGLPVAADCPASCQVTLNLSIPTRLARKLGLKAGRAGSVVIATGRGAATQPGTVTIVLRFTSAARRHLARAHRLAATLQGTASLPADATVTPLTLTLPR